MASCFSLYERAGFSGAALPEGEALAEPEPRPARLAYAAADIVMQDSYGQVGHSPQSPGAPEEIVEFIDWETTSAIRQHVASHGFGIAEAMDTAQRLAIGWVAAQHLIRRCGALQLPHGFVAGATADRLASVPDRKVLTEGACYQIHEIRSAGGIAIILPLTWLSRWKCTGDEYVERMSHRRLKVGWRPRCSYVSQPSFAGQSSRFPAGRPGTPPASITAGIP